jgi:glutaconate CoA-transferase subunit A
VRGERSSFARTAVMLRSLEEALAPIADGCMLAVPRETSGVAMAATRAQFQAAEKGVPFMPLRGLIGSDLLAHRTDWKIADNPFGNDDPIVLLPALRPDVAFFHAPLADRAGNVFIGTQRELVTMAHAAQRTIVTVEDIHDGDLLRDPLLAAGTLPGFYVEAVVVEPRGAWPLALPDRYGLDAAHLSEYARLAVTAEGFAQYLDRYVHEKRAA